MANSRGSNPDIVVVDQNKSDGADYILGDVHANFKTLSSVMELLTHPGARLFIVGDLTDRGENSLEVIRVMQSVADGRIFCVRGNHEDMCLNTIRSFEELLQMSHQLDDRGLLCFYLISVLASKDNPLRIMLNDVAVKHVTQGLAEGGEQIFKQKFGKPINHAKMIKSDILELIKSDNLDKQFHELLNTLETAYEKLIEHRMNGGRWLSELILSELTAGKLVAGEHGIDYGNKSEVKVIKDYMSSLPYIVQVPGDKPFNMVHAAMPFNDKELQARISSGSGLSDEEKSYATLARQKKSEFLIQPITGLNESSVLTYVGHTVGGGVREETNTVNLDVGMHECHMALVVNHTASKCVVIKSKGVSDEKALDAIVASTQKHLDMQALKPGHTLFAHGKKKVKKTAPVSRLENQ